MELVRELPGDRRLGVAISRQHTGRLQSWAAGAALLARRGAAGGKRCDQGPRGAAWRSFPAAVVAWPQATLDRPQTATRPRWVRAKMAANGAANATRGVARARRSASVSPAHQAHGAVALSRRDPCSGRRFRTRGCAP